MLCGRGRSSPVDRDIAPDGGKHWVLFSLTFSCGSYSWHGLLSYLEMTTNILSFFLKRQRTPQVVQWFRIHLPRQGTQVWALVRENSACHRAAKSVPHDFWACVPEPVSHNYRGLRAWSPCSEPRETIATRSLLAAARETCGQQQRSGAAKNK